MFCFQLRSRKLLLGLGGEYMRRGLFSMIDNMSQVRDPKTNYKVISNQNPVISKGVVFFHLKFSG